MNVWKKSFWFLIVVTVFAAVFYHVSPVAKGDPDRYFHLAIARQISEQGMLRSLPQVENLKWGNAYPNGYFLFSLLTGAAYRMGGERAALFVGPILVVLLLAILFIFACEWVEPWLAAWIALAGILCPEFALRAVAFRPHLLGIALAIPLVIAIYKQRPFWVLLLSALFSLSYHAFYIPLLFLLVSVAAEIFYRERVTSIVLWGLAGLALGIFLNPSFPHHLQSLQVNLGSAFGWVLGPTEASVEVQPLSWGEMLGSFSYFFIILGYGLWEISTGARKERDVALILTACLFWGLGLITGRAIELAVPLSLVAIAVIVGKSGHRLRLQAIVPMLGIPFLLPFSLFLLKEPMESSPTREFEALRQIPATEKGKKVFNCDWETGSLVLYQRPDLRFVDLLDAHFLQYSDPSLHSARLSLKQGIVGFPYGIIRNLFDADYILCKNPGLNAQLDLDPHFKRLYPRVGSLPGPYLFQVSSKPLSNFLTRFEAAEFPPAEKQTYVFLTPKKALGWVEVSPQAPSPFLDLYSWIQEIGEEIAVEGSVLCAAVRPTLAELKTHWGATALGVGGGARIRLWWNDEPLFLSNQASQFPHLVNDLVKLPHPLRAGDRLAAVVCSRLGFSYMGLSLSFWNPVEIRSLCEERASHLPAPQDGLPWRFLGNGSEGCQASSAHPNLFP